MPDRDNAELWKRTIGCRRMQVYGIPQELCGAPNPHYLPGAGKGSSGLVTRFPPPITTALGGLAEVERRIRMGRDGAGQRHAGGTLRRRGGRRAPWLSTCGSFGGISPHIDQYAFQRLHLFEDTAGAER